MEPPNLLRVPSICNQQDARFRELLDLDKCVLEDYLKKYVRRGDCVQAHF